MTAPKYEGGKCGELDPRTLETTFFYPGPADVARRPGEPAKRAWEAAKEICIECPVYLRCRAERLGEEFGVWGGLDEHERHLIRRGMAARRRTADEESVAAEAARLHAMAAGHRGMSVHEVARRTGVSLQRVRELLEQHEKTLAEVAKTAKPELPAWKCKVVFPATHPPMGDGWVWRDGLVYQAHYLAQTGDGEFFFMKLRVNRNPMRKWFPREHVSLRARIAPTIQEWAGRADGIQEKAPNDQRSGKRAA
jgi:transposase